MNERPTARTEIGSWWLNATTNVCMFSDQVRPRDLMHVHGIDPRIIFIVTAFKSKEHTVMAHEIAYSFGDSISSISRTSIVSSTSRYNGISALNNETWTNHWQHLSGESECNTVKDMTWNDCSYHRYTMNKTSGAIRESMRKHCRWTIIPSSAHALSFSHEMIKT